MTRSKKTRSLKRIHQVKTGSKQKLKRAIGNDRQGRKCEQPTLSVYEKYLLEQAKEAPEKTSKEAVKKHIQSASEQAKPNFKCTPNVACDKPVTDIAENEPNSNTGDEDTDWLAEFAHPLPKDTF